MTVSYHNINERSLEDQLRRSIEIVKEQKMKKAITVKDKSEGTAIERGLENPVTRAIVTVEGILSELEPEQQQRVMDYVALSLRLAPETVDP